MQAINTTTMPKTIDVVTLVDAITPHLIRMAQKYNLDSDDFIQDVTVRILEIQGKIAGVPNQEAYCIGVARYVALTRKKSVQNTLSLDAPLSADSEQTLHDILPEPQDTNPLISIMHRALHRLSLDEQHYLADKYNLNNFHAHRSTTRRGRLLTGTRTHGAIRQRVYNVIKQDTHLLTDLGISL